MTVTVLRATYVKHAESVDGHARQLSVSREEARERDSKDGS